MTPYIRRNWTEATQLTNSVLHANSVRALLILLVLAGAVSSASSADTNSNSHSDHSNHGSHSKPEPDAASDAVLVMTQAQNILNKADLLEQSAVGQIQQANQTRKLIKQFRVEERKIEDPAMRETQKRSTDALAAQIELWQTSSAQLRDTGTELRQTANALFVSGFSEIWREWINNPLPLTVDSHDTKTMAHNNQIRSAHPSMTELTPSTGDMPEKHEGMTMRVPDMASQPSTEDLDTATFQLSRDRNFLAHIEVEPSSESNSAAVPINEIHRWRLIISDLNGKAIEDATIEFVGHMPGHVHGLPTQPRITDQLAAGVYRIEGVKFQMHGWWVIEFNIVAGGATDTVKFDILL